MLEDKKNHHIYRVAHHVETGNIFEYSGIIKREVFFLCKRGNPAKGNKKDNKNTYLDGSPRGGPRELTKRMI